MSTAIAHVPAQWLLASAAALLCFCFLNAEELSADDTPPADQRRHERHALTNRGDVARGRKLFLDEKLTKCLICHKLDGKGGEVGPDLSAIGGKFGRPHLIESLLEPSRQIVEGFRSSVVALASGRVITGIVKEQSERNLALVDAEGQRHVIPVAEIAERQDGAVSLMPDGLEKTNQRGRIGPRR